MDILSARKKAAERAKASQKTAPEVAPAVSTVVEKPAPPAATAPAAPAEAAAAVPGDRAASVRDEPADAQVSSDDPADEAVAIVREIEMLSFRLGDEEYAVTVDTVKEVLKIRELTTVPNAPDYVLGIMALRGPVLPIIDLCKRLGLPPGKKDEKSRIIVVSVNEEDAGLYVDRVTGVVRISPDAVRPTPETIEHGAEFLRGIARKDDTLYILLDLEKAIGT